jgi:hypothetical protein
VAATGRNRNALAELMVVFLVMGQYWTENAAERRYNEVSFQSI